MSLILFARILGASLPDNVEPTTQVSTLTTYHWEGRAKHVSASLIVPLRLTFISSLCSQLTGNLKVTTQTLRTLLEFKVLGKFKNDLSFKRQLSSMMLNIEHAYVDVLNHVGNTLLCEESELKAITEQYIDVKEKLDRVWTTIRAGSENNNLAAVLSFLDERPVAHTSTKKPALFLGPILGLAAGLITGGILGSIFKQDNSQAINAINKNLATLDQQVKFTNRRIDVLAQNVTDRLTDIKIILANMHSLQGDAEMKAITLWNFEQLKQTAIGSLLILKITENSLTLLRSGTLNTDLIDLATLQAAISEGLKFFADLEFPIPQVSRETLGDILSLIDIQYLGPKHYVAILPLTSKVTYKISTLVPHPVQVNAENLMIAEMKELLLYNSHSYIITGSSNLHSINPHTHILKRLEPIWDRNQMTCEWAGFTNNITSLLTLCNFNKLGTTSGIFTSTTPRHRLLYLAEVTQVELNCPDGKVRDKLKGAHLFPTECDLSTDYLKWPAQRAHKIDVTSLIATPNKSKAFDITHLPPFTFSQNETHTLHDSIKTLIDNLPSDRPLTFSFKDYDLSLEEVTSYNVITSGVLTIFVITNTVLIIILYLTKVRRHLINADNRTHVPIKDQIKNKLLDTTNSLILTPRNSFRRLKRRAMSLRHSFTDSERGTIRSSLRRTVHKGRGKLRGSLNNLSSHRTQDDIDTANVLPEPAVTHASTNTPKIYPQLSPAFSTPYSNKQQNIAPLPSY